MLTLPVLIYAGIVTFDLPGAAVIATVQVVLSLALYLAYRKIFARTMSGRGGPDVLWNRRSRTVALAVFGAVVLVVFIAPLGTVLVAGLAGSWTGALPSNLGVNGSAARSAVTTLASLSVSLQTAFVAGAVALLVGTWAALAARTARCGCAAAPMRCSTCRS